MFRLRIYRTEALEAGYFALLAFFFAQNVVAMFFAVLFLRYE